MPWYTTDYADDIAVLRLAGDPATRCYQWLGGLDGLLLRGQTKVVVSLERVTLADPADASFLSIIGAVVARMRADVVYVLPAAASARRTLHLAGRTRRLPVAATVDLGIGQLAARGVAARVPGRR